MPAYSPLRNTQSTAIKSLISGAWDATSGQRPRFIAFIILFVIAYSVDLLSPWAIGYTLGVFVKDGITDDAFNKALLGIAAYIGLRLVYNICHHAGRYLQQTVSYTARMKTLEQIFSTLLRFPLSWHVNHHSGENLSRLHRSSGAIDVTVGSYLWQIIDGLVKTVFASIALFTLDLWVAVNVTLMGVFTILVMIFFNKRLVDAIRANNSFVDKINRICVDYLFNVITIKSLGLEKGSTHYLSSRREEGYILNRRILRFSEMKWGVVSVGYSLVIGSSLLIFFHGHRDMSGAFDIAQVYVLLNYLDRIFQAIGSFTGYFSGIIESATAYEDATKIFEEAKHLPPVITADLFPAQWSSLSVNNLDFTYSRHSGEGMRNLHLSINRGDKIALVGPSGSGKSTILKLLGGLLIPERCTVQIDNKDGFTLQHVAAASMILPQEPEVFSETVTYNMTMGEKFAPQELSFFVSLCKVEEVINKLPSGWDSHLAESGMNLSVGEKQRFALARGLIRAQSRHLLLLDEPTSSLDPMTEKQIFYGLLHHFADRTILTACHHLALVPLFTKIVYVRANRIEEVGTFQELIDRKGLFYKAWCDYEEDLTNEKNLVASPQPHGV